MIRATWIVTGIGYGLIGVAVSQVTGNLWWGFWTIVGLLGYFLARPNQVRIDLYEDEENSGS